MNLGQNLEQLIAEWASLISRRAIDADPELRQRLESLEARSIELNLTSPPTCWHLVFESGALAFKPGAAPNPNVIVSGAAFDLANWLFRQDTSGVRIEGDDTTLLETVAALRSYNPEIQDALTQVFGTEFSQRVVGGAEAGLRGVKSILQAVGSGLEQQAAEKFVNRDSLDDFLTDIDELRLRVDRLAANIKAKENPP